MAVVAVVAVVGMMAMVVVVVVAAGMTTVVVVGVVAAVVVLGVVAVVVAGVVLVVGVVLVGEVAMVVVLVQVVVVTLVEVVEVVEVVVEVEVEVVAVMVTVVVVATSVSVLMPSCADQISSTDGLEYCSTSTTIDVGNLSSESATITAFSTSQPGRRARSLSARAHVFIRNALQPVHSIAHSTLFSQPVRPPCRRCEPRIPISLGGGPSRSMLRSKVEGLLVESTLFQMTNSTTRFCFSCIRSCKDRPIDSSHGKTCTRARSSRISC